MTTLVVGFNYALSTKEEIAKCDRYPKRDFLLNTAKRLEGTFWSFQLVFN